eukprot:c2323_g1_i1 orf=120-1430(+)
MSEGQQIRIRSSFDSFALFRAALSRISNTDSAYHPQGELFSTSLQDGGLQGPSRSLHPSIDGQVRVLEGESMQEPAQSWPPSSSEPFTERFSVSSHGTASVSEAESIVLPYVECARLSTNAEEGLLALPRVSKTETSWLNEQSDPCTDAEEASLASFPSPFPSFKRIPGTRFIVDGFRHAGPWSKSYFLSHFHSDHYTGLSATWDKGIIFCSHITARLVIECIKVPLPFVCPLPMGEPVDIDSCRVTLVDANHCPGAVQFLFQVPTEKSDVFMRYVHTGDMRYSSDMNADPSLCDFVGADAVFLDTTYCNPKFVFPAQNESINYIAEKIFTMREESSDENEGLAHVYDDSEEVDEVKVEVGELQKECGKERGEVHADAAVVRAKPQWSNFEGAEILSEEVQCFNSNLEIEKGSEHNADDAETDMGNSMQVSQRRSG